MKQLIASTTTLVLLTGATFAANLPSRKAAPVYAPPPPMWTGFYAGLNLGATIGTALRVQTTGYSVYQW